MNPRHSEAAFETVIEAHLLAQRLRAGRPRGLRPRARDLPRDGARLHPRDAAEGVGQAGGAARGQDRRADPRRPVQVDGRERRARDAAPRLQVLRADAPCGVLQGGARAEPGAGSALRRESPGADPPASLLAALREVPRCHAEPERHPRRHGGAEEPAHGPDGSRMRAGSTSRTATRASRSSSSSAARWSTSRWTPSRC